MTEINNRIEWLYNPNVKPAKELSKHDQQMIKLGWDARCQLFTQLLPPGSIDAELYWQVKAILRGVQMEQQNNPNITWRTTLDAVLERLNELEKTPQSLTDEALREKIQTIINDWEKWVREEGGEEKWQEKYGTDTTNLIDVIEQALKKGGD